MNEHSYTVNVVVRHRAWSSNKIASKLEWQPFNAWSVGDRRVTPDGTELPGIRQDTMCSFRFAGTNDQLTSLVVATVEHLMSHHELTEELHDSGGSLAMNIRFNGHFNSNLELTSETLRALNFLRVMLSIECLPDG